MRTLALAALLAPALALGQVHVSGGIRIDLPVIIPPLIVIEPGIRVVPDVDVEVFHSDGFYWTRHEGRWYRSDNPRGGWVHRPRGIPPGLARMTPGRYRRWHPDADRGDRERHGDWREDQREREKDRREDARERAKAAREHEREREKDRRERAKEREKDQRGRSRDRRERERD